MELPYNRCQLELQEFLQAQYPLIFLRSSEEIRAMNCAISAHQAFTASLTAEEGELARWNSLDGFQKRSVTPEDPQRVSWKRLGTAPNPKEDPIIQALNVLQERLEKQATPKQNHQNTYILPDWSTLIQPDCHLTARQLKELVIAIERLNPRPRMTLIVIGTDWSIPAILRNHVHILDLPLPIGKYTIIIDNS